MSDKQRTIRISQENYKQIKILSIGLEVSMDKVLTVLLKKRDDIDICKNCKYPNRNNYCEIIDSCPDKDFGCNKFEMKED